jgi:hypothetical protein
MQRSRGMRPTFVRGYFRPPPEGFGVIFGGPCFVSVRPVRPPPPPPVCLDPLPPELLELAITCLPSDQKPRC